MARLPAGALALTMPAKQLRPRQAIDVRERGAIVRARRDQLAHQLLARVVGLGRVVHVAMLEVDPQQVEEGCRRRAGEKAGLP